MIDFNEGFANRLMINPRLTDTEKNDLQSLQSFFNQRVSDKDYFLIASSGTSRYQNESLKLVALSRGSVLNSATRFNKHFQAKKEDNWGLVLPDFHVAGLGIYARAFLARSQVFSRLWEVRGMSDWIQLNNIAFISMVPAQVFDLVEQRVYCPSNVKALFVGGGALSEILRESIRNLKWPLIETYGMTETASMIACREGNEYKVFGDVEVKLQEGCLTVHCDSLLTATLQKVNEEIVFVDHRRESWYVTSDEVTVLNPSSFIFLRRKREYIKILGEGVSLVELRDLIEDICTMNKINPQKCALQAIEDDRSGFKLILAAETSLTQNEADFILKEYHAACRPYEKIAGTVFIEKIPRTELGKLKTEELQSIVSGVFKK